MINSPVTLTDEEITLVNDLLSKNLIASNYDMGCDVIARLESSRSSSTERNMMIDPVDIVGEEGMDAFFSGIQNKIEQEKGVDIEITAIGIDVDYTSDKSESDRKIRDEYLFPDDEDYLGDKEQVRHITSSSDNQPDPYMNESNALYPWNETDQTKPIEVEVTRGFDGIHISEIKDDVFPPRQDRSATVELENGALRVRCYDAANEGPLSVMIGRTGMTVTDFREKPTPFEIDSGDLLS